MTQSLSIGGYSLDTDPALQFPTFKVNRLRQVLYLPRPPLSAFQYLWILGSALVVVLGGHRLPASSSAVDLLASSLAQDSAIVTPAGDYRTRRTLRMILQADPSHGISLN